MLRMRSYLTRSQLNADGSRHLRLCRKSQFVLHNRASTSNSLLSIVIGDIKRASRPLTLSTLRNLAYASSAWSDAPWSTRRQCCAECTSIPRINVPA